jgi:hypothetical protein
MERDGERWRNGEREREKEMERDGEIERIMKYVTYLTYFLVCCAMWYTLFSALEILQDDIVLSFCLFLQGDEQSNR